MQKQKKHCVFLFFEGLWLEKITKHKKKQVLFLHFKTQKKQGKQKTSFATKPKSLFKVVFFFLFLVSKFWGYYHSLHITSFQMYQDNEQGLYYLCVCFICMYVCREGHDTRGFEVDLRGGYHIHIIFNYAM